MSRDPPKAERLFRDSLTYNPSNQTAQEALAELKTNVQAAREAVDSALGLIERGLLDEAVQPDAVFRC